MVMMFQPFSKSVSSVEKCKRLMELVSPEDTLAVIINADPDSIASALALKRLFWRRVKKTLIFHINPIKRADNLALIKLLKIDQKNIRKAIHREITKWALVDSQPYHDEHFNRFKFDIIIDHHPFDGRTAAQFVDIKPDYGANSTIMTEYLRAVKIKPSPRLATALFYGIKTDTDNFVRPSTQNDINAFRYLYQYANLNIIKKIESSEITKKTLESFKKAIENLTFVRDIAFIHMGKVNDPDILVIIADFFLKMAEATWCIVSGIYGNKFIIIFRNAGFRLDAGKLARKLFGEWGTAGGHKSAARAEIPIHDIEEAGKGELDVRKIILQRIKGM
ncbi:MAG: DHH family phosphoesterase [Deltaproteobacteria bacterium]|nr:DHH family phosphoesterase [Deltaproteobacteria bacterium]